MNKEDLVKLTEALADLGYKITKLNYSTTLEDLSCRIKRELELTLSLSSIKP